MNWYIWIIAGLIYLIFSAWYFNWKGPLTADEIELYIADMSKHSSQSPTDSEIVKQFLEVDDGKEFVMLNLVRLHKGDVAHPETGEVTTAAEILQGYFGPFSKALFHKAGQDDKFSHAATYEHLFAAKNMGAALAVASGVTRTERFILI